MTSTRSPLSALANIHSDRPPEFTEAIEAIKAAASLLSRPEVIACLTFLKETANAVGSIQDTLQASSIFSSSDYAPTSDPLRTKLYDAVNVVPMTDAVKAVAMQDTSKAVAIQHAVKTVALREAAKSHTFSEEEIRSIVSDDAARAIALIRHFDSTAHFVTDRRLQRDRRKDH